MSPSNENASRHALQVVAIMEAVKGVIVFGAGFGLLTLLHRDVRRVAVSLVTRLHIDPEQHYAGIFLNAASKVTDAHLWALAALAVLYSALRATEAYGLWFNRRWAAWLGAASGAIYVPIEIYELIDRPNWVKAGALIFNLAVIAYLVWTLKHSPEGTNKAI
jgi:uncharacterized membrane protein (DUF2068 family)